MAPPTIFDIDQLRKTMICKKSGSLWVFGYASLIWKPGFTYTRRIVGHINGFSRRFYQGTTTHRGTAEWPGRVATLLKEENEQVWGVAYEVNGQKDIDKALEHLAEREMITGGYHFEDTLFYPAEKNAEEFCIQVYIADPGNQQYLGEAALPLQAYQIAKAVGVCGANIEYVRKVGDFMRTEVPSGESKDVYLFTLEAMIHAFNSKTLELLPSALNELPIKVSEAKGDHELASLIKQRL